MVKQGKCNTHRKQDRRRSDKHRPSASARGYDADWAKKRKAFLNLNPICLDCGAPATVADHAPLTRRELVDNGIAEPDAPAFLQPRCESCHNRKTAKQDGGFGHAPS